MQVNYCLKAVFYQWKSFFEFLNPTFTFENEMVELCMQLFQTGLSEHKRRETEVNSFFSGQDKTVTDYQQKASQILANFEQQHKKVSLCFRKPLKDEPTNSIN